MKKKKLIALMLLMVMFIGATYAYLPILEGEDTSFNTKVIASTTDSLIFSIDSDISISATPQNFNKEMGNAEGEAHAKAVLKANNKTNQATDH